jgi:hypothetical protein
VTTLKRGSDAMLLLAIVFLVVAIVGPSWAYGVAGACLVASVVLTVLRRRRGKAAKAARA